MSLGVKRFGSFGRHIIAALVLLLFGCESTRPKEQFRASNSSMALDLVCTKNYADATVAEPTAVYVVEHGAAVQGEPLFIGDLVEGLSADWVSDSQIRIKAKKARVYKSRVPQSETTIKVGGKSFKVKIDFEVQALQLR